MTRLPGCFQTLPLRERLFVRARLASAPLEVMAALAPEGRIADVGCGHGALSALLLERGRRVVGIDVDAAKIAWARRGPGQVPGAEFAVESLEALAARAAGQFDAVVIADVLYLVPPARWPDFLTLVRALLRPGGELLLKEAENDGSWRARKALWQEWLMVRALRRTASSGAMGFRPRQELEQALDLAGFSRLSTRSLARGYSTPHVLFHARCG